MLMVRGTPSQTVLLFGHLACMFMQDGASICKEIVRDALPHFPFSQNLDFYTQVVERFTIMVKVGLIDKLSILKRALPYR